MQQGSTKDNMKDFLLKESLKITPLLESKTRQTLFSCLVQVFHVSQCSCSDPSQDYNTPTQTFSLTTAK